MKQAFVLSAAFAAVAGTAVAGPYRKESSSRPGDGVRSRAIPPGGVGSPDGPGWSDNFDSYANGSALVPQGNWKLWDGVGGAPPASQNATVDNALAASPPHSALSVVETDVVQTFNHTTGQWVCRAKTYMPTGAAGIGYFIMLNTFVHPYVSGGNWSIQVNLDNNTGIVTSFNRSVANGGPGNTTLPLIRDQWVEIVVNIDLDANSFTMTYGGQPLVTTGGQWSWNVSATAGLVAIQCIDLYSQCAGFRWDDVSLQGGGAPPTCYPNCDNSTIQPCLNVQDFGCFLNRFANGESYANCDNSTIAPVLNVQDFGCFLNSFANGCSSC